MYNIDTFQTVMYSHAAVTGQRPHYGLAVYSKLPVLNICQPVTFATTFGSVECALVQIPLTANITLSSACIYRRPSSDISHLKTAISQILSTLQSYQSASTQTHYVLIMGDFNLDWCLQSTQSTMSALLPGYRQLVTEYTTDYRSIIDHIYTNIPSHAIQCTTAESYFSDHKLVIASLHVT